MSDERLINAWISMHRADEDSAVYKDNFWAETTLSNLAQDDPSSCWKLILKILSRDQHPKVLQGLAAGALEDLLSAHGEEFIELVEERALSDSKFRYLLGGVWQNEMSDEVWRRVQAAAGTKW
jgi:hypothetical protein